MGKEDDVWKSIVDNFGERAKLDPDELKPETPLEPDPADLPQDGDTAAPGLTPSGERSWDDPFPDSDWTTDRFVPPPPPPLPATTTDRLAAWVGVFGAPAALLILLILPVEVPQLIVWALIAAFVGGFLYLVIHMSREPRDPGDDGARL